MKSSHTSMLYNGNPQNLLQTCHFTQIMTVLNHSHLFLPLKHKYKYTVFLDNRNKCPCVVPGQLNVWYFLDYTPPHLGFFLPLSLPDPAISSTDCFLPLPLHFLPLGPVFGPSFCPLLRSKKINGFQSSSKSSFSHRVCCWNSKPKI